MLIENTPTYPNGIEDEIIVPWSLREILFSLASVVLLSIVGVWVAYRWPATTNIVVVVYELAYVFPVLVVLFLKRVKFETLGFRSFTLKNLAIGCGLLFGTYLIIMVHNLLLLSFGIAPQGEYLTELFNSEEDFWVLVFVGVIIAPLAEEIFFRGFLFSGFRQKYGWKRAALLSAALFSVAHLQLVVLIPTFLMGFVLAYLFHHSKSIWPGVILHLAVNAFTFGVIYLLSFLETFL